MKKILLTLTLLLGVLVIAQSQPPQALKYKAVAKDEWGVALPSKDITLRFTILLGSETGTVVYQELHYTTTNKFGLMDVNIGEGNPLDGYFDQIDWGAGSYYMKVELDTKGGLDFKLEGADKLLSVPYALYAGNATNSNDNDSDPENELISHAYLSGTILYILEGNQTLMVDLWSLMDGTEDDDADPTNELQDLSLSGNLLNITQGSTIDLGTLSDLVDDADADPLNEIQDLQLIGNILTITGNSTATEIDLSSYIDNTDDQLLSLNGYELSIENGNTVVLPDLVEDADADPTNELQDITLDGTNLSITNGSTIDLSVLQDGYEPDTDDQTLSIEGHNLTISEGNTVELPDEVNDADNNPANELQTLTLVGDDLVLSHDGGTVPLPPCDNTAGQFYFADKDGDGFGTVSNQVWVPQGVTPPQYYVGNSSDCNDDDYTTQDGSAEICDGIDNDCDGIIDNNLVAPLAVNQLGVCLGLTQVCAGAFGWQEPDYAGILADYELYESLCDELDNDCDGLVDETCQCTHGETRPCESAGLGACAQGTQTCINGYWEDCTPSTTPVAEICNGIDDDCDGLIDEDWPELGQPCTAGDGACANQGYYVCAISGDVVICSEPPGVPLEEDEVTCDYIDNDCDGLVDEAFVDPATGLYVDDQNCGGCGISCESAAPNTIGYCTIVNGIAQCDFTCAEGFLNLNGLPADGCEYFVEVDAIYVATPANGGNDVAGCGNLNSPCATITNGIQQAIVNPGKTKVLVSSGVYTESIQLENGISVLGGHNPHTWEENPGANITTISGLQSSGEHQSAVQAIDITEPTTFSGFTIQGPINQNPSGNSYGIYVLNSSSNLIISNNTIIAGSAGNGVSGNDGNDGIDGVNGYGRTTANSTDYDSYLVGLSCVDSRQLSNGGLLTINSNNVNGGNGGGNNCPVTYQYISSFVESSALPGFDGASSGGPLDGSGGLGGANGYDLLFVTNPDNGTNICLLNTGFNYYPDPNTYVNYNGENISIMYNGADGSHGNPGLNGFAGSGGNDPSGLVVDYHWKGFDGANGVAGGNGGGGGGGGSGGGCEDYTQFPQNDVLGAHGGGGGSGAEGGGEGIGGSSGGSSFAIFIASSNNVIIDNNTIHLGIGGNGGNGGVAGVGGIGGIGALGGNTPNDGTQVFCSGAAGKGGNGGNGGHGGGGGGGAGGSSFGIYTSNDSGTPDYVTGNTFSGGVSGRGGNGGSSMGNPGEDGTDGVVEHVSYH